MIEKEVSDHTNTARVLKNILAMLDGITIKGLDHMRMVLEAHSFVKANLAEMEAAFEAKKESSPPQD